MGQTSGVTGRGQDYPNDIDETTFASVDTSTDEPDTEALVIEIEHTRTEMSGTIDAIQERLNPDHLKEQAVEMVREATVGKAHDMVQSAGDTARDTGNSILDTIRQNPLPAAVAGIGLGWLWKSRSKTQHSNQQYSYTGRSSQPIQPYLYQPPTNQYQYQYQAPPSTQGSYSAGTSSSDSSAMSNVTGAVTGTASTVGSAVADTASTVAGAAASAVSGAGQATGQAFEQVGQFGAQAGSTVRENYDQMIRESPMTLGVVALGLGLAAGMMLPETQVENQVMGETKENLMDKAQTVAHEAMDKVQQVASQATDSVQQSAQQPGLTSSMQQSTQQGLTSI